MDIMDMDIIGVDTDMGTHGMDCIQNNGIRMYDFINVQCICRRQKYHRH